MAGRPGTRPLLTLCLSALTVASIGLSASQAAGQFTQGQVPVSGPVPASPGEANTYATLDADITALMATQ